MMGREKRAKLLVPSFIVAAAAAAAACGGTSVGQPTMSSAGAGGDTTTTNPPPISYGGIGNPPPLDQGGYGSVAGGTTNPPPIAGCPTSIPQNGSACAPSASGDYECDYNTESACTTTLAYCRNGTWSLAGYAIDCSVGGSGGSGPLPPAGAAGEGPTEPPTVTCPPVVPSVGAYCYKPSTVTSYLCDYTTACGSYEATCDGHWLLTFQDGPADSCMGGYPGE